MDHLPTDLLREIFDLLDPNWDDYSSPNHWVRSPRSYYKHPENRRDLSDLARLRLVCKRFSSLGAQYLFRCVVQRFNRRSFRRLECLAEHPELGRHVKKFVYLMPYLYVQGSKDFATFKLEGPRLCRDSVTRAIFDDEHFLYPQIYAEQQDIIQSSYDLYVLKKAMKSFRFLQRVTVLQTAGHIDLALRRLAHSAAPIPRTWDYVYCCWTRACHRVTETLFLALQYGDSSVRSFICPVISPQGLLRVNEKIQRMALVGLWRNLTSLELSFDDREFVDWRQAGGSGRIRNLDENIRLLSKVVLNALFHAAENLSGIYLGFDFHRPLSVPFELVFDEVTWPRLRTFGVESWRLSAKEIVDFVKRHRRTLKGLRLGNIQLREGDYWRDVVMALRRYGRELQCVSLDGCGYEKDFNERKEQAQQIGNYNGPGLGNELSVALGIEVEDSSDDETDEWLEGEQEETTGVSTINGGGTGGSGGIVGSGAVTSGAGNFHISKMEPNSWISNDDDDTILMDNGETVTYTQRRRWEKWITGTGGPGAGYNGEHACGNGNGKYLNGNSNGNGKLRC